MTNVRFSHADQCLVSIGGTDTAVVVWRYSGGSHDQASVETDGGTPVHTSSATYLSEDSDTDSEEEGEERGVGERRGRRRVVCERRWEREEGRRKVTTA